MINKYPSIFLSSADSYSDLWPLFFDMFKKYWPEYSGVIYLNTEEKTFSTEGLNIICTKVGKNKSFGISFRKGLEMVKSDNVMLIMIDYIFMGKVNDKKITEYYDYYVSKNLDSLCLVHQGYPNIEKSEHSELHMVYPPAPRIMFSYQIAFWKKAMLKEMALPHENPWTSEWYGTLRAEKMKIKLSSIANTELNPIPYDLAGCLHKGKWLDNAIEHLNKINYRIDFAKRGFFTEQPPTIKNRFKIKWMLVKDGLKGSYWDLWKRKALN